MSSVVVEETVETQEELAQYSNISEETQAPEPEQSQEEPEVPSKFQGKSVTEIVDSYENLEKELGRKGQEIGELRKLTDGILKQQLTTNQNGTAPESQEEEADFFDDPNTAVSKAIENHPKFREFEAQQAAQKAAATTQQLKAAHPDYSEVISDAGFQEWVKKSPIRTNLYVAAHNDYNLPAAMELLENWKERKLISNTSDAEANKAAKRDAALRNGKSISRSSSESTVGKKIYRRADLIRLKTNDPQRYEALQDEILQAYSEGRVK
tara:strand:+ start:1779 stop:2579 length:801 start_codon:yes stop_codon:yes gene_type:complete